MSSKSLVKTAPKSLLKTATKPLWPQITDQGYSKATVASQSVLKLAPQPHGVFEVPLKKGISRPLDSVLLDSVLLYSVHANAQVNVRGHACTCEEARSEVGVGVAVARVVAHRVGVFFILHGGVERQRHHRAHVDRAARRLFGRERRPYCLVHCKRIYSPITTNQNKNETPPAKTSAATNLPSDEPLPETEDNIEE